MATQPSSRAFLVAILIAVVAVLYGSYSGNLGYASVYFLSLPGMYYSFARLRPRSPVGIARAASLAYLTGFDIGQVLEYSSLSIVVISSAIPWW